MLENIWNQFLQIVKEEVGSRVVETWFKAVSLYQWDSDKKIVYLHVPNGFIRDWILKHYQSLLRIHLGRLLHVEQPQVELIDKSEISSSVMVVSPKKTTQTKIIPAKGIALTGKNKNHFSSSKVYNTLNPNYTFDTFVVASSNSLSYAAAYAVTEKLGCLYNPLFIYGRSGLGKTHLMHAIAHEIKARHKKAVIIYQTGDRFVQEFISAIRFDTVHAFRTKYQVADILLIDDMQFMANKEHTQEAFYQLFNILYDLQKQIVFSSDTFPQNMNGIVERLRSRLAWGLVTDVYMPCLETKIAILKRKAEHNNEKVDDEVAHFIASNVTSNIRELEGALVRVLAFASFTKQAVTLDLAQTVLFRTMHVQNEKKDIVNFDCILKCIGKYYKYDRNDLKSKNRNKDLVFARHVSMFLMKKMTNKSLRDIGYFLGSRNHATIKYGICKIEQHTKKNQDFRLQLHRMQQEILKH